MPIGTGADTLQNIPAQNFVTDPSAFFAQTIPNVLTPASATFGGFGSNFTETLLQTGIVSKIRVLFGGSLVIAGGAATPAAGYPYSLLESARLSANGQNDLISVSGIGLHALRHARYPASTVVGDTFTAGSPTLANGTYPLVLTWELPIAMDDTTLIGSLYAQSSATNLTLRLAAAQVGDFLSTVPGTATINGTWYVQETLYEIPFDTEGRQIIPDLTRLHSINEFAVPLVNTGDAHAELIRTEGQLSRLFMRHQKSPGVPLSFDGNTAAASRVDTVRLQYGGNQRPLDYNPAHLLYAQNSVNYGTPLPYNFAAFDFLRENPPRDALLMQGVTNLEVVSNINAAVVLAGGTSTLIQETLF